MHEGKKKLETTRTFTIPEAVKKSINADCVPILHWF